jgi:hypothetical protein
MMITGDDSVILTSGDAVRGVGIFLDGLGLRWPLMEVSVEGEDFYRWNPNPVHLPKDSGTILIARDRQMVSWWDDNGYTIDSAGEGPLSVSYSPASWKSLRVNLIQDPMSRKGFSFIPYEAVLVGASYSIVSIVTPPLDSGFSAAMVNNLASSLAAA